MFIPGQWATWFSVANFAHGPFPLLLILLYCLAWSSTTPFVKYSLVLFINFLTIYTGFGLFLGVLTPILLALDYWASTHGSRLSKTYLATVFLTSVASLASFFIDYKIWPTADCFSFHPQSPISYLKFVALMFANFFGIAHFPLSAQLIGTMIMAVLLVVAATLIWWLLEKKRPTFEPQDRNRLLIIVCLIAYTLLFCLNTAYGRLCLGLHAALQSRYVIYLVPAVLGLYFFLVGLRHSVTRNLLLSGFLIAVVAASLHRDRIAMGVNRDIKQTWKKCYLQSENITECDKVAGFPIYSPSPQQIQRSHLQYKLEYLKKTRQNLYLDQ